MTSEWNLDINPHSHQLVLGWVEMKTCNVLDTAEAGPIHPAPYLRFRIMWSGPS